MLRKILVVDDSELLHRMYDLILMRYRNGGTSVLHARDGAQAVNLVHQHGDVDLVLLDVNMPVMGGLQVLDSLRVSGGLHRLNVIMVSTEGHEADVARALATGASAYVTKPFTPARLHELIAIHCGEASPVAARTT
ncbi:MAG: response regulator [Acidobacteriota bacterium]